MDIELALEPRADLVRTARLVAGAAARRAGVAEDDVDDVRLAVGEAAARAVLRHGEQGLGAPILLLISGDARRFVVRVCDATDPASPEDDDGLALALVGSLAGSHAISGSAREGSVLEMTWPVADPTA